MRRIDGIVNDRAAECFRKLRSELDEKALEALMSGKNWAEGPVEDVSPERWFQPFDIFQPIEINLHVKCGPVDDDFVTPHGWRMIRRADWVEAGRPGIDIMRELDKPRCQCPEDTRKRVLINNGCCNRAGCPYGGDI